MQNITNDSDQYSETPRHVTTTPITLSVHVCTYTCTFTEDISVCAILVHAAH